MCLEAPESIIQVFIEEIAGFDEAKKHIPAVKENEAAWEELLLF